MAALLRQIIMQAKSLFGGATSMSIGGLSAMIPSELFDMSLFTDTTPIFGLAVPTYLIYFFLSSDD